VGTLVLIALGIVFWPLIVTAPDVRDPIVLAPMPEAPLIDRTPISAPESYQAEVEAQLPSAPTVPESEQIAADDSTFIEENAPIQFDVPPADEAVVGASSLAKPDDSILIDKEGLAQFWVLQVATLASEARAVEVVENLKNQGYKAFYRRFVRGEQTLFRVQIGPNAERERLQRFRPQIDKALGVESEILRYTQ
jgi:cell division septation protein DedD